MRVQIFRLGVVDQRLIVVVQNLAAGFKYHGMGSGGIPLAGRAEARIYMGSTVGHQTQLQ